MSARLILLGLGTIVAGLGTLTMTQTWMDTQRVDPPGEAAVVEVPAAPQPAADLYVLVASEPLQTGRILERQDLVWQAWPDDRVPPTYTIWQEGDGDIDDIAEALAGYVVIEPFFEGEPIAEAGLVAPGTRGFLAAVLRPGFRAVSVEVDEIVGIAGLVHPGDYVDVILAHSFKEVLPGGEESDIFHRAAETVLTGVRVLAIDTALDQDLRDDEMPETATLEATPQQAELVALVRQMGEVVLSLNGVRDPDGLRLDGFEFELETGPNDGIVTADDPGAASSPLVDPSLVTFSTADLALQPTDVMASLVNQVIEAAPESAIEPASFTRDAHMPAWQLERVLRRTQQTGTLSSDASLFLIPPTDLLPSAQETVEPEPATVFRGRPPGGAGAGAGSPGPSGDAG